MRHLNEQNELMSDERDGTGSGLPGTITVVVLLTLAALVFSYLGAFAVTGALVSADVISPPPAGEDPRFANMAKGFVALMTLFTGLATMVKLVSSRQLRKIDAMAEER
jgi:hypothetical protein